MKSVIISNSIRKFLNRLICYAMPGNPIVYNTKKIKHTLLQQHVFSTLVVLEEHNRHFHQKLCSII